MNQLVQKRPSTLKELLESPSMQNKIKSVVNGNPNVFASSIIQISNSNKLLAEAEPLTVVSAAITSATLNLPLNNTLGFAYIVPYREKIKVNGKDTGKYTTKAQFQIGYKGFIQLAIRSGQFERLVSMPVYQGQLTKRDPIHGFEFDWDVEPTENSKPIGYYAYFRLTSGYSADCYMTHNEMEKHAKKYSQTYKKGYGNWSDNFEAMALKTVIKLLLSKYAPLSIDMQNAIEKDQAVIVDDEVTYVDNQKETANNDVVIVSDADFRMIKQNYQSGHLSYDDLKVNYSLSDEQLKELQNEPNN